MAKLTSESLSLEIRFQDFDTCGWVQYEVLFLWQNEFVVNDTLLKRESDYWSARSIGAFKANDYRADTLIPTIERVLDTNEADYWEPIEPDVIIAFYPNVYFPFLKSRYKLVWESEEARAARKEKRRKREETGGKLPDDVIAMIVFIDAYNLRDCEGYTSEGIALVMCPTRCDLEAFCSELKQEYIAFKEKYRVDEYREEGCA